MARQGEGNSAWTLCPKKQEYGRPKRRPCERHPSCSEVGDVCVAKWSPMISTRGFSGQNEHYAVAHLVTRFRVGPMPHLAAFILTMTYTIANRHGRLACLWVASSVAHQVAVSLRIVVSTQSDLNSNSRRA